MSDLGGEGQMVIYSHGVQGIPGLGPDPALEAQQREQTVDGMP